MNVYDKRKQSLYFPSRMLESINCEAKRLDRSLSWVVQYAWRQAEQAVQQLPAHDVHPPPSLTQSDSPAILPPADGEATEA